MKRLFYFCSIFLFFMFNCSVVVLASTDFDGDFSGSSTGNSYTYYNVYFCISAYYPTANLVRVGGTSSGSITAMSNASVNGSTFTNRSLYLYRNSETGELVYLNGSFVGSTTYAWSINPVYIPLRYDSTFSGYRIVDTISNSQGSITGTFEGDIVLPQQDIIEYPPSFPTSTSLSYSYRDIHGVDSVTISSPGISLSSGYSFAICPVTFTFEYDSVFDFKGSSFYLPFSYRGSFTTSGSIPAGIISSFSYITDVSSYSSGIHITALDISSTQGLYVYGDVISATNSFFPLTFTAYLFVTQDIPSFTYTRTTNDINYFFYSDNLAILDQLKNQNNSLTSAGGANSGLNSQNNLMAGALSDYQRDTDTSAQYSNIKDSLFVLDTSIFTQVASTITLFSSVVTGFFNAFGDFSVPLTLMLIVTLISCIIGIIKISSDSS